ncbi:MAG: cysteine--tRNA ligase, partial [Candidatus Dormibacteraceae bacterium]
MPLPYRKVGDKPTVNLYVCGVTPYEVGHMGHAFTFSAFDILIRSLERQGMVVRYVQNITDIDDPLFERARRDGVTWQEVAQLGIDSQLSDMRVLGLRRPDVMPRPSQEIPDILQANRRFRELGVAYQSDAFYFSVRDYPSFGNLSRLSRRAMLAKLREQELLGQAGPGKKRDLLDFELWRRSAPDEPSWPSEFGPGRPGWHIECSVMAAKYLDGMVDIHGGGSDLIFSHHEAERAQNDILNGGKPVVKAWMHVGMVKYQGQKMSKSLG